MGYVTLSGINYPGPSKIIPIASNQIEYTLQLTDLGISYEGYVQLFDKLGETTDLFYLNAFLNDEMAITSSSWNKRGIQAELRFTLPKSLWKNSEKTFASFICRVD